MKITTNVLFLFAIGIGTIFFGGCPSATPPGVETKVAPTHPPGVRSNPNWKVGGPPGGKKSTKAKTGRN